MCLQTASKYVATLYVNIKSYSLRLYSLRTSAGADVGGCVIGHIMLFFIAQNTLFFIIIHICRYISLTSRSGAVFSLNVITELIAVTPCGTFQTNVITLERAARVTLLPVFTVKILFCFVLSYCCIFKKDLIKINSQVLTVEF